MRKFRKCSVFLYNRKHFAKGFCSMHYLRMYRHGSLAVKNLIGIPLIDRILAKVKKEKNGCWIFSGCKSEKGYGMIWDKTSMVMAHRVMYESVNGPIPSSRLRLLHIKRMFAVAIAVAIGLI